MAEERWGGNWTDLKLMVLEDYLRKFQIALKKIPFRRIYIDGFAGDGTWSLPGESSDSQLTLEPSEAQAMADIRDGSALIALGVKPPFDRYYFNDRNSSKTDVLRNRVQERGRPNDTIEILSKDANKFVLDFCRTINPRKDRGVILLDPFGIQVDWSTVEAVARTQCIDMWYLFPTQAVVRMLPRSGVRDDAWSDRLDRSLGATTWREEFYRRSADLFGTATTRVDSHESFSAVEAYVVQRLTDTFKGTVLDKPLRLGPQGNPMFSFLFASANPPESARKLSDRLARGILKANRTRKWRS